MSPVIVSLLSALAQTTVPSAIISPSLHTTSAAQTKNPQKAKQTEKAKAQIETRFIFSPFVFSKNFGKNWFSI
jgi:hypothetical protein